MSCFFCQRHMARGVVSSIGGRGVDQGGREGCIRIWEDNEAKEPCWCRIWGGGRLWGGDAVL